MKDALASLNSLKDSLQVLQVAKTMLPQISEQFDQMGDDMENNEEAMMLMD